jgi:hypothetical protein
VGGRARLSCDVSEIKLAFQIPRERPTPNIASGIRFAHDSALVGAVSSEPVSGMKRRASFLHFIPASRAREGSHEKPATAGLSCREFVSEVKSRSLQEGFM